MTFDDLVGIPWIDKGREISGCDCWGLLRLAHLHLRGVELPSYHDRYATAVDRATIDALIRDELVPWDEIASGAEQPFDGVLLAEQAAQAHVGLVVRPGHLLHVVRGETSVIEAYRAGRLAGHRWHRIVGFYRYRAPNE